MQLLEILTNVGVYTATLTEYGLVLQTGQEAPVPVPLTPLELFTQARNDVLNGCTMNGWTPTDDRSDGPYLFAIEPGAKVISTKLYTPTIAKHNADDHKEGTPEGKIYSLHFKGEYLGNKIQISGIGLRTASTDYLLPLFVDGVHACDSMKGAALAQQVQLWKETQGVPSTDYLVILPDVPMTASDAADYLEDYVRETDPPTHVHGNGSATAWPGWNET